jgi:hypothetical protein
MNYIALINQFWRMRRTMNISHAEVDLYFYLLNEANELRWKIWFSHPTRLICASLGMSNKVLSDCRNRLKQKGLINYKEGSRAQAAQYEIINICVSVGNELGNKLGNVIGNINGNKLGNVIGNISGEQSEVTHSIQDKLNETKQEKEILHKIDKIVNITFDAFWNHYDKKVGMPKKCKLKWDALTDFERTKAMEHISSYKTAQPDKQFRKNPETYLNNKSFNDEIIPNGGGNAVNRQHYSNNGEQLSDKLARTNQSSINAHAAVLDQLYPTSGGS